MKTATSILLVSVLLLHFDLLRAEKPFKVECLSTSKVAISFDSSEFRLSTPNACVPKESSAGRYVMENCLGSKNNYVLSRNYPESELKGGEGVRTFTVNCSSHPSDNGQTLTFQTVVNTVQKNVPIDSPAAANGTMFMMTSDPSVAPELHPETTATLGKQLFLVMTSENTAGDEVMFLPEKCSSSTTTSPLWAVNKTSCEPRPHLLRNFTIYKKPKTYGSKSYNLAYAIVWPSINGTKIESQLVTYSCTVRYCPSHPSKASNCSKIYQDLTTRKCINDASTTRRRRSLGHPQHSMEPKTVTFHASITIVSLLPNTDRPHPTQSVIPQQNNELVPIVAAVSALCVALVVVVVVLCVWIKVRARQVKGRNFSNAIADK